MRRLLLPTLFVAVVLGKSSYQGRVPNGARIGKSLGHSSGSSLNAFGAAFNNAGLQWTVALCKADSDGDGKSNGFELGDPDCVWKVGDTPTRTTGITNPSDSTNQAPTRCGGRRRLEEEEEDDAHLDAEHHVDGGAHDDDVVVVDDDEYANYDCAQNTTAATEAQQVVAGITPPWVIAHGFLLGLAWCVLAPVGIVCALPPVRPYVGAKWISLHRWCLIGVAVLTVIGCIIPIVILGSHGDTPHKVIGLIVLALVALQPLNAYFRPPAAKPKVVHVLAEPVSPALERAPASAAADHESDVTGTNSLAEEGKATAVETITIPGEKSARRVLWEFVHKNLGRVMLILALADVGLGIDIALAGY